VKKIAEKPVFSAISDKLISQSRTRSSTHHASTATVCQGATSKPIIRKADIGISYSMDEHAKVIVSIL
jgi:hypothetical protein